MLTFYSAADMLQGSILQTTTQESVTLGDFKKYNGPQE